MLYEHTVSPSIPCTGIQNQPIYRWINEGSCLQFGRITRDDEDRPADGPSKFNRMAASRLLDGVRQPCGRLAYDSRRHSVR